jgi:hypothetical protein
MKIYHILKGIGFSNEDVWMIMKKNVFVMKLLFCIFDYIIF